MSPRDEKPAAAAKRLQSILRASPAGVGVARNHTIVEFNGRLMEITGYSREELTGMPGRRLYPSEAEFEFVGREKHRQMALYGRGTVECRWVRKDGALIDVLLSSAPLDPADPDQGVTFIALDISEQRRATRALEESERKYRALFEANADAAYVADQATGRILDVSGAACRLYGYGRDEFLRLNLSDLPADPPPGSLPARFHKRKDGSAFPVEVSANAAGIEGRELVIVAVRDLSRRLEAERKLRASEERFRALLDAVPGMVYVSEASPPFRTLQLHGDSEALAGVRREPLLSGELRWVDCIEEQDRERYLAAVEKAAAEGGVYALEYRLRQAAGGLRWLHDRGHAVRGPAGRPETIIGVVIDITAWKLAEEALERSEYEKSLILNSTSEAFTYYTPDLRIVWVNRAAASLAGTAVGQLAGRKCYAVWHGRGEPCEDCPVLRAKETGLPQQGEVTTPDGRVWLVRAYPIRDPAGETVALVEFGQDITARKRNEEALKESEQRFRLAAQLMGEVICDCDFTARRVAWSGAIEKVTGYGESAFREFGLDDCRALIHPDDAGAVMAALDEARRSGQEYHSEFRFRRKDGQYIPVEMRGAFLAGGNGTAPRMLGTLKDVSGRKRTEERLLQAQKMESVGRLAGGIAHDFNNLLTVINGYSALLLERLPAEDPLRPGLSEIGKAGQRAAELVRQLLAFSRKQMLQPCVLNVNGVVSGMTGMLRRLLGEDIELRLEFAPDLAAVRADPGQIHQVLLNLAANARDAMPGGGRVTVRTWNVSLEAPLRGEHGLDVPPGRYCAIAISDTGAGMSEPVREHLFEPFFTTKEVGKGTGLGLSTVHGIVTQSGGYVSVASELGKGTTFTIYLPAVDDAPVNGAASTAERIADGAGTILVVEDQPEVAGFAAATLQAHGYRVLRARGPFEALEACRRARVPIDLLLTDVVMPEMNGRELAGRVRELLPGIRVLYMSGYQGEALAQRLGPENDAPLLPKPFTPSALAERVAQLLHAR